MSCGTRKKTTLFHPSIHPSVHSLTGAKPSGGGSRLSRVVSASFSPAMLSSPFWGTPRALAAPTGIYNPSNESWAYPRAFAQLAPGTPSSCSVPRRIPPGGGGGLVVIQGLVVAPISGLVIQIDALFCCLLLLLFFPCNPHFCLNLLYFWWKINNSENVSGAICDLLLRLIITYLLTTSRCFCSTDFCRVTEQWKAILGQRLVTSFHFQSIQGTLHALCVPVCWQYFRLWVKDSVSICRGQDKHRSCFHGSLSLYISFSTVSRTI